MHKNSAFRLLSALLVVGMLLSVIGPMTAKAETQVPQVIVSVDQEVLDAIETTGTSSYWINFNNEVDLSPAYTMNWEDRGRFVYETLKAQADLAQVSAVAYLTNANVSFQTYWINNSILVESSDAVVLNAVSGLKGVASITGRKTYTLYEPEKIELIEEAKGIEPNLTQVKAPLAWELGFDGTGYVVANIDTGVRYSHEALVDAYRGNNGDGTFDHNYNWFNPIDLTDDVPRDGHGHGSHTMGTMVGDDGGSNQIGIAPGAEWMACAGCPDGSCPDDALLGCGEFITAPTDLTGANADPDMRPNAVNNSWGDCGTTYDDWYEEVISAWHAAGIYPVFSNGNNSNCGYSAPPPLNTVGNPARSGNVTGVGSSGTSNGQYASHSNKGPTDNLDDVNPVEDYEMMKPQVIAPGVNIRSSIPDSDTAYQSGWTGTSMSAPHVTGLVSLMLQAGPCLVGDYATIETLIESTATPITYDDGSPLTPIDYPNFATGWGEINALAAVQMAGGMCGDSTLTGTVKSTSNAPIPGAKVVITGDDPVNNRTVYTNSAGEYTASVNPDTFDIVVSAFGYETKSKLDVIVGEGQIVTEDFVLTSLPSLTISGVVTDGGILGTDDLHGYPLYAKLTFTTGTNALDVYTDPFTGAYTTSILQETDYTVKVVGLTGEYLPFEDDLNLTGSTHTYDVALMVPAQGCGTPGYGVAGVIEDFNDGVLPAGWSIFDYAGSGMVWHFDDPVGRGNRTGGDGAFAMVDSDWYGSGGAQYTGLQTPVLDFTDATSVQLEFDSYLYWSSSYPNYGDVYYSTNGGTTWSLSYSVPSVTQELHVTLDLTDELAGESEAMVEFRFEGDWAYYWQVDNVSIGDPTCEFIPGGAVAGYVFDANLIDSKLMGAKVATAVNSDTTAPFANESGNGLYWFFEPFAGETEEIDFTISKSKYETKNESHTLTEDEVTHVDFELGAGHLIADPLALEMTMDLGQADTTQTLTLENDGTGATTFTISEKNLGFEPLAISIPAFTGEIEKSDVPQSIFRDPNASATSGTFTLSANAGDYGITEVPPAYGVDLGNNNLYRWDDLSIPGASTLVGTPGAGATSLFAGDFKGGDFDTLYGISYDNNGLYAIDTTTAVATLIGTTTPPSGTTFSGLTDAGDVMYGMATACNTSSTLMEVNLDTAEVTTIGVLPNATCMIDIAYIPSEDAIYGVDLVSNALHRIDPATGVDTVIGQLGVDANYAQGMDFDEENEILYWASYSTAPELRIIDITTGASALVGAFTLSEVDAYSIAAGGGPVDRVPWLTEDPIEGVVNDGETASVTLTYTVDDIGQPGDYLAELSVKTDTPYPNIIIPVTLHVTRPASFGSIKGDVFVLEQCDVNPTLAEKVVVKFYQNGTLKFSTMTDANGHYSYAMPAGTYDLEFLLNGYVSQFVEGIVLAEGADVVVDDITLRLDAACLTYDPEQLYQELYPNEFAEQVLTFTNTGAKEAVFEITERSGDGPVPFALAEVELVLDDGNAENAIGIGGTSEFMWLNRFTPAADQFPFTLNQVQISFEASGAMSVGDDFRIVIYQNLTGNTDPAVGSELLYQFDVEAVNITTWNYYDLPEPVTLDGPGDVLIGVIALTVPGSSYYPASIDESSTNQRSWAGWWSGSVPANPTLPPDESWILIDSVGYPGNWTVRGIGTSGGGGTGGDIVWLTVDPMAGVILPDGTQDITITFDSAGLTWGDYFGTLRVMNDPDPKFDIPVQLRIIDFDWQYLPLILRKFPYPGH